jgi:hypothetical protein
VVENGEEKKAWVLLTGGGVLRASGDTSEKEEDREQVALRRDEVDEDVERDSSGRVVAGDHCCANMAGWCSTQARRNGVLYVRYFIAKLHERILYESSVTSAVVTSED